MEIYRAGLLGPLNHTHMLMIYKPINTIDRGSAAAGRVEVHRQAWLRMQHQRVGHEEVVLGLGEMDDRHPDWFGPGKAL